MALEISNPLHWPEHLPRTPRGRQSNLHGFSPTLTVEEALNFLDQEVEKLHPMRADITTHIEHFNSPRLRKLENISPAVTLSMRLESGRYHIACDRWLLPQHNLYALVMTLRTIAQLDGWGVITRQEIMEHFRERVAAPKTQTQHSSQQMESWRIALGLGPTATLSDANSVYRARAKALGDSDMDALALLNEAIEQARQALPHGE